MADLNAFAVFVAVAEAGGFTAAARELRVSKSAVSKSVSELERRLGVRLLNRTTRRLSLTEAGRRFLDGCRLALAAAEAAERDAGALAATPRGLLRVNAPVTFGLRHLSALVPEFMARYPDIAVEIDLIDRRVDLVEEGYDVAVRIGALVDSTLVARRLADNRYAVCAAPSYLAAQGRPLRPEDLAAHDCLIYSYQSSGRIWRFAGPRGRARKVRVNGSLVANNGDLLLDACRAGRGICLSPTFMCAEDLAAGRLVPVLADWTPLPGSGIYALFHESRNLVPKVRVFVDFLVEKFSPQPAWDRLPSGPADSGRA